jgi:hypothetical protein
MVIIFALSWGFVFIKTKDCELLCGEKSIGQAKYRVGGGGFVRNQSRPMKGSCDCGDTLPAMDK